MRWLYNVNPPPPGGVAPVGVASTGTSHVVGVFPWHVVS